MKPTVEEPRGRSLRSKWALIPALAVALVVAGALLWVTFDGSEEAPEAKIHAVSLGDLSLRTNLESEVRDKSIYLYAKVNQPLEEIRLESDDKETQEKIQELLQGLDTFVPGEQRVTEGKLTLSLIVDGLYGEEGNEEPMP